MEKSFNISGKCKDVTLLKGYAIKHLFIDDVFIRQGRNVNFSVQNYPSMAQP